MYVCIRDVTELRLRRVGFSDWFHTSDSEFGSDNFESKIITKIERFGRGQPKRAPTSLTCRPGNPHTPAYFSIVASYLWMCIIIYIWLIKESALYFYYFIMPAHNNLPSTSTPTYALFFILGYILLRLLIRKAISGNDFLIKIWI